MENTQHIVGLGFTELEAAVLQFLVSESPATGYRIAQALGRPVGNIYKTIESLQSKGAVITTEENENRLVRAVPVNELLDRLERRFEASRDAVRSAFADAQESAPDDAVYELHTTGQVLARARAMLSRARDFAILTLCPAPLAELQAHVAETAARGVHVGVKVFEATELGSARVIVDPRGRRAIETGPGQWLVLSLDGTEFLQALFSADGASLLQAFWTANAFLSWMTYTGLSSDFVLADVKRHARQNAESGLTALIDSFAPFETPLSIGKQSLIRRYRTAGRVHRRRPIHDTAGET